MDTLQIQTNQPRFDRYLDWLKYQALAERIWAGAGSTRPAGPSAFAISCKTAVNLIWMDPGLARRQILLHASQQFIEGDVVHWFHRLQDGRTGFVGRTHASDNLLWLAWAVVEYVARDRRRLAAGRADPLPRGRAAVRAAARRQSRDGLRPLCDRRGKTPSTGTAMRAIDLVLDKRMGAHGLPLMGTGDWNDGLDEIGSQGRGESVWLGFFLYYILERMDRHRRAQGRARDRQEYYLGGLQALNEALELTWRGDRYLRAIHDDGSEIGVKGSGVWEIDALTAAWAVMSGINPQRGQIVFDTALRILEKENTILLGWPPLREDTKPYLGRSSRLSRGRPRKRHVLPWRAMARRGRADPGRAMPSAKAGTRRPGAIARRPIGSG